MSDGQIQQAMLDAHDKALDQAVETGLLSQYQADWMDSHFWKINIRDPNTNINAGEAQRACQSQENVPLRKITRER